MPVPVKEKFDCIAQQIVDVMSVVEIIKPVVPLIRAVDTQGTDVESLKEAIANYEKDIHIMSGTISEMSEEDHKDDLNKLLDGYSAILASKKRELEGLIKQSDNMKEQIEEYLKYANSFHYVSTEEILLDLLEKAVSEDTSEEEFFAIILLLNGKSVVESEIVTKNAREYSEKTTDITRKGVLKFINNYTYEEIRKLILD